ncbi:uncharacterized protein LOC108454970 [Gossypium arboreum]|uniref:uncharacterized protein LOC108454970 n=1 Tax=Gossypium arboreum TaxID=29729 RepID=UPI00081962CF|nr:uncharacterized protein LOC108454970 [Gossypium arboreum]
MTIAYHPEANELKEVSTREIKQILEKMVNPSLKDWAAKIEDVLWAYRIAYKTPLGMSPEMLGYGKNYHLPIKLERKAYWVIKELNLDPELAKQERIFQFQELEEFIFMAYENTKIYKERSRLLHDAKI